MGRPPSNGGPAFRFNAHEVAEMETILHEHNTQVPAREVLQALADKFSLTPERSGKIEVQMKQVWNWFQNRRYAIRAKAARTPVKYVASSIREDPTAVRNMTQVTQHVYVPAGGTATVQSAGSTQPDSAQMEFEAKSARDGAWYDVTSFLSHKSVETGDPHVLVRFAGFGPEEDEWVNVRKHVRQRSLPCESAECVAVLPGDLILCFQEGKEQALYYDAHVLDAQRRRHDMRGCRCRFLVRYDHDQSEEIVPLKKVCRRPDTDHRLQQLHAMKEKESGSMNQQKTSSLDPHSGNTLRVYPPSEPMQKLQTIEERVGTAAVRLPTNTESKAIQPPQNMDVRAQLEASQPKSAEPISVGNVETTVAQPSKVDLPSGSTATLTASNAETWTIPPASATTNTAAIAKAAESSEAYPAANSSANIDATTSTNAETSVPTQADSAMNIDGTVETTMADTSTVPPAGSAADTSATSSAAPTVVAETSVIPSAMDVAIAETSAASPVATTSTVVSTVNVEASVVSGTVEPSVAAPANVDAPSGGDTTAASGMGSDQNMPQG